MRMDAPLPARGAVMTRVAVYCFSGSGHSRAVAGLLASELHAPLIDLPTAQIPADPDLRLVVVFPVYCQQVPAPVRTFLRALRAGVLIPVAVWGCVSHGDVLRDVRRMARIPVVAAAYIPVPHSYLPQTEQLVPLDRAALSRLSAAVLSAGAPAEVRLPRAFRNPFAGFFPAWRSRVSVRLERQGHCTRCGHCASVCPVGAMQDGIPNRRCIRCLRCVSACPCGALSVSYSPLLLRYLARTCAALRTPPAAEVYV